MPYKDKGRPEALQFVPSKKVKVSCQPCINGNHDECVGRAANYTTKCLCKWNKHQ